MSIRKGAGIALVLMMMVLLSFSSAAASHVAPNWADGNPTCPEGLTEFKIQPVESGTYTVPGVGTITLTVYDDQTVDFTSSFGIDVLIVKAGSSANIYSYDEATADDGLHGEANPVNNQYYGLSHLSFCYDQPPAEPLVVSKTADPAVETSYAWEITKSADPTSFVLFAGQSATPTYSVNLVRSETSVYSVSGTVTIQNPNGELSAEIASVSDVISQGGVDTNVALACTVDGGAITFPYSLAAGATMTCSYEQEVGSGDDGSNNVSVATSGSVAGNSASAGFSFAGVVDAEVEGFAEVNVTDVLDGYETKNWASSETWPQSYSDRTFTCPTTGYDANGFQQVSFVNTATIVETSDAAQATVTLDCYMPMISKTATTAFDRDWAWTIEKSAETETVEFENGTATVAYSVTVDAVETDSNRVISGEVTIVNPHPSAALDISLSDLLGGAEIALTCDGSEIAYGGSVNVGAGATLVCAYSLTAESSDATQNVVTGAFDYGTPLSVEASADVTFDSPSNETDACITVYDDKGTDSEETLGEVCADAAPHTFTYEVSFEAANFGCAPTDVTNTARFAAADTANEGGQAMATVTVGGSCQPLEVSKTVEPTATTTYAWEIDKNVDPMEDSLFAGQTVTPTWSIQLTRTESTAYALSGLITIANPNATQSANVTGVTDVIGGSTDATVSCETPGGDAITFPYELAGGDSITCSYEADLDSGDAGDNVVTVTTEGHIEGGSATVPFSFDNVVPTIEGPAEVDVTDERDGRENRSFNFVDSGTETYEDDPFACPTDLSLYTDGHLLLDFSNTATIDGTQQSDSATFTLHCYALAVSKTAETTFDRSWSWEISKTSNLTEATFLGGMASVTYSVTVDAASTDSNTMVSGTVTISNPHPTEDATFAVSDLLGGSTEVELVCDGATIAYSGEVTVTAGSTLLCTYEQAVTSSEDVENEVSFSLFGVDYSASATATFGSPTTETDGCVDVTDSLGGTLGTVCADEAPRTFTYTVDFDEADYVCGLNDVVNTASFVSSDTGATGEDSLTVSLNVPCGCTYTQGYWKTHANPDRKQFDETWSELADGADTEFFDSGLSWLEVFNTPPRRGNAYYQLAHQYMAAYLNLLSGAAVPAEVLDALEWSETFFTENSPTDTLTRQERQEVLSYASLLGRYNNGQLGPAHCD